VRSVSQRGKRRFSDADVERAVAPSQAAVAPSQAPGGSRELLDHVADIANILATGGGQGSRSSAAGQDDGADFGRTLAQQLAGRGTGPTKTNFPPFSRFLPLV
jgi:hypothetical protein